MKHAAYVQEDPGQGHLYASSILARISVAAAAWALVAPAAAAARAPVPLVWSAPIEVATGGGERGPWRQNESRYDYVDDPTIALDASGRAIVTWVDQKRKDVYVQAYGRDGKPRLRRPVNVSRLPAMFSWLPRIALSARRPRDVYALWQEIVFSGGSHGGDIFFARSADGGATFGKPINLSRSKAGDGKGRINRDVWHNGSLDLAVASDGTLYAAWTAYEGELSLARSSTGGASFSTFRRIAGDAETPARAPALAVAADGAVYLAWTVGEDDAADIRVALSSHRGDSFAAPVVVHRTSGYSDAPKIAVDAQGVLHLVYAESAAGPFDRYHVRYTRSRDGGRSFEPAREISGALPGYASSAFPGLSLDDRGNVYVLWELYASHREPPRALAVARSCDGGDTFSPPSVVPGSTGHGAYNGSLQGLLMRKLAVNGAGEIAIVNSSFHAGEGSRVRLVRSEGPRCGRSQ